MKMVIVPMIMSIIFITLCDCYIGKGLNIWDEYSHRIPNPIDDGSNADIACDSYHKIDVDVELLKSMGVS